MINRPCEINKRQSLQVVRVWTMENIVDSWLPDVMYSTKRELNRFSGPTCPWPPAPVTRISNSSIAIFPDGIVGGRR